MPARRGLAEPGRAGEQQVVGGLAARRGRLEHDREVLLQLALADELVERRGRRPASSARPRRRRSAAGLEELLTHGGPRAGLQRVAQQRRASPSVGQLADGVADLVGAVAEPGQRFAHVDRPTGAAAGRRTTASSTGSVEPVACSSTSSRSAVFLPTPGPGCSAPMSSPATMSTSAAGECSGEDRQRQRRADAVGARSATRTSLARRGARSRTASGRPRGCGGGRTGRPVDVGSSSASVRGVTVTR